MSADEHRSTSNAPPEFSEGSRESMESFIKH
jgi:hypothetical protein